jgi:hypothetical protein
VNGKGMPRALPTELRSSFSALPSGLHSPGHMAPHASGHEHCDGIRGTGLEPALGGSQPQVPSRLHYPLSFRERVPPARVERATPWFVARYSDPLSYGGMWGDEASGSRTRNLPVDSRML